MRFDRAAPIAVIAFAMLAPANAGAQDPAAEVARRELVDRAETARDAGDHAEALRSARRAGELRMSPSLRLFIAQEEAETGELVAALADARRCEREAEAQSELAGREDLIATCRALAAEIAPQLGSIVVRVMGGREATVTVMGHDLEPTLIGVPVPVTPGRVRVAARGRGGGRFERELEVQAGEIAHVDIELRARAARPTRPDPHAASRGIDTLLLVPGIALGVLGVASVATSGGLFALQEDAVAARDAVCDASGCDPIALEHDARVHEYNAATNATLIGGLIALGASAAWIVVVIGTSGGGSSAEAQLHIGPAGAQIERRW